MDYTGTFVPVTGDPTPRYRGWKILRTFADIRDGLANTLMVGEKHVTPDHQGDYLYGDGNYFTDDSSGQACRLAGPNYPLAASLTDPESTSGSDPRIHGRFGSWHPGGVCQFVMGDGSVHALSPTIDSTVLGYLANCNDNHVIPGSVF
jgi:hypothetical protein